MDKSAWNPKSESVADSYIGPGGIAGMDINNNLRNYRNQMATAVKFFEANDIYPTVDQLAEKFKVSKEDHIEVTTVKTADSISIEINDMMRSILDKYKDIPSKNGLVFPYYTNQAMNRDIKVLCRIAGIDQEERIEFYGLGAQTCIL